MRIQANKSALKAMVINRIGDWGLSIGIFLTFYFLGTVDFLTIFALAPHVFKGSVDLGELSINLADLISFFLFFGVVGKSAQFGLHT